MKFITFKLMNLILLLLFLQPTAQAKVSLYAATRTNFSGIGAARVGFNSWEFGLFAPGAIAANKVFIFAENFYATLGFGLVLPGTAGVVAGAGFNIDTFFDIGIRGELFAMQSATGYSNGAATLGLSWNF